MDELDLETSVLRLCTVASRAPLLGIEAGPVIVGYRPAIGPPAQSNSGPSYKLRTDRERNQAGSIPDGAAPEPVWDADQFRPQQPVEPSGF
jgi:hypothetical protein